MTSASLLGYGASPHRLILYGLIIVLVVMWRPDGLVTRRPTGTSGGWPRLGPGRARGGDAAGRAPEAAAKRDAG